MLTGNSEFNARADLADQAPSYFVTVDGIANTIYATVPVSAAPGTVKLLLGTSRLSPGGINLLEGSWTVARVTLPFHDLAGEASTLFGVGGPSAPVGSWKNRVVTLKGGYRDLAYQFFVTLFTGRVTGLELTADGTTYELELSDTSYLLDGELCTGATETTPATIRGNVVNVLASFLRGVFSTSDPDFPLESVSTDTGSSSAPTGLGIDESVLDIAGMKVERDTWRPDDRVELEIRDPEPAREYLRREFFRTFQARLTILGNGALGFRFNVPALPASAAPAVTLETIERLESWGQLLEDHLNRFRISGDHDPDADPEFEPLYDTDTTEDTDDRTATGETVEYLVESRWLRSTLAGEAIAAELAGRLRQLWLPMPALASVSVNFRQRRIESGDVIAITHPDIPDQRSGVRGVSSRLMTVLRTEPDLIAGRIVLELLDVGLRRYGVISPSSVTGDYSSATETARNTFAFVCNSAEQMGDGSDGYRLI